MPLNKSEQTKNESILAYILADIFKDFSFG